MSGNRPEPTADKIRERIARHKAAQARLKRAARAQADLAAKHAAEPVERYHQRIARLKAAGKRVRIASKDDRWCILCTTHARTLALAASLVAAGFDAWTPVAEAQRRRGPTRDREYVDVPMLPGFVFAHEDELRSLMTIIASPISPHPDFSIFVHDGRAPLIKDGSLNALRLKSAAAIDAIEAGVRARAKVAASGMKQAIPIGARVKVKEDANFLGMTGVVEICDGRTAKITFGGKHSVKIDAWRLLVESVEASA